MVVNLSAQDMNINQLAVFGEWEGKKNVKFAEECVIPKEEHIIFTKMFVG